MRWNMRLFLVLTFCLLLGIYNVAFAVTLDDYQGTWEATQVLYSGMELSVDFLGYDVVIEIEGNIAYLTSEAMDTDRADIECVFEDGILKSYEKDVDFIYDEANGFISMNMKTEDGEDIGFRCVRKSQAYESQEPQEKNYQEFDYRKISREPDKHIGECYTFSGKVTQVEYDDQLVTMIVATREEFDDEVLVLYPLPDGDPRILEGDVVTVEGVYGGLANLDDLFGETNEYMLFNADQMTVKYTN